MNNFYITGAPVILGKTLFASLFSIFGLGKTTARKIVSILGVKSNSLTKNVTIKQNFRINRFVKNTPVHTDLRFLVYRNLCLLKKACSYTIFRRMLGLPARGNSRNNGKTMKHLKKINAIFPFSFGYKAKQKNVKLSRKLPERRFKKKVIKKKNIKKKK